MRTSPFGGKPGGKLAEDAKPKPKTKEQIMEEARKRAPDDAARFKAFLANLPPQVKGGAA